MSVPGVGPRLEMAIPRAFVTNVAVCELSIDHPTTRLENVSFGNGAVNFTFTGLDSSNRRNTYWKVLRRLAKSTRRGERAFWQAPGR